MRALNSGSTVVADNGSFDYPSGRVKDNTGTGNGTQVNERVYGDLHQAIAKLMRLYAITPNGLPDNETNGFQIVEAFKSLASKNDYIYPLSSASGVLSVDIKFANMQNGEFIVCRASVDKTSETQIKGFGATTFAITYSGSFKANEYVRVIKTSGGVSIVRLSDATSLDAMVSDFLYLKKASISEENAGAIDTKATTPLSNLTAFVRRINGLDSGDYLATEIRNGLLSMEDKAIINGIGSSPVKNKGYVYNINLGESVGTTYPYFGNFTNAIAVSGSGGGRSVIEITMANTMDNNNYKVNLSLESVGNIGTDSNATQFAFKVISTSKFQLSAAEFNAGVQNLKLHLEVVQL